MNELLTPEVEVDAIDVDPDFNARKTIDPEKLKRLAASFETTGLVEPIVLVPGKKGRFKLVAGERRLKAAQLAGMKRVPYTIYKGKNPRTASFVENVHREKLNAIEEAEGLEALATELGLTTNKALAEEVDMSSAWVGTRRRLLKLPDGAQAAIARNSVPIEAEPLLRKVATASPRIAECVCELFEQGDSETGDFVRDFDELIYGVADGKVEGAPLMLDPHAVPFAEVIDDQAERDELVARYKAAARLGRVSTIRLGDAEVTAARAARVLLELDGESGEFAYSTTYITDKEMAADLVVRAVERREKEEKALERKLKREATKRAKEAGGADEAPDEKEEKRIAKEREEAEQQEREQRDAARGYNERIGRNLMDRRSAQARKKYGLARTKAVAIALLFDNRSLPGAGLRLVMPQLKGAQTSTDSEQPAEAAYATPGQALEYLVGKVKDAKSQSEVIELITDAQIAAVLADDDALEAGEGSYHHEPAAEEIETLLAEEIKELTPRRSPKQRKEVEESA
ncbi:MAG: ParB/RepB/Spo0J family partition protein [Solirubrobacterales bacterium]